MTQLLIDTMSLLFRAHYALPPMNTAGGEPTSAIYGFSVLLLKLLREQRPNGVAFAFEGGRTHRHESYADYNTGPFCNLADYDFVASTLTVIEDGLLPTGALEADGCYADFIGPKVLDITGNLREITWDFVDGMVVYPLMGGAFSSTSEHSAACDFDFYVVDASYQLNDTGFRCCFDQDPTL